MKCRLLVMLNGELNNEDDHLSLLASLSLSISSSTSPIRTGPFTFLIRCRLSASLPEMRMTLTWVMPPRDPVLPNNCVTLALTGSDSMVMPQYYIYIKYQFTITLPLLAWLFNKQKKMTYRMGSDGVNPEFVGLAERYSEVKHRRRTEEREKKSLESRRMFTETVERKLETSIYSKSVELRKLQTSRMRKLQKITERQQMKETKRMQIAQLKEKNLQRKQEIREKLKKSRMLLQVYKQQGWQQLKSDLKHQTKCLQAKLKEKAIQKALRAESIRKDEEIGLQRVHQFHKKKNNESLQAYMSRIQLESRLKKQNELHSKKLKKELKHLSKSVTQKKDFLCCLEEEIGKFKTEARLFNSIRLKLRKKVENQCCSTFGALPFQSLYKHNN